MMAAGRVRPGRLLRRRSRSARELVAGSRVKAGDAIIGLPASGPHANGFSLIRRLLERAGLGRPTPRRGSAALAWPTPCSSRPGSTPARCAELSPHRRRAGDGAHHRRRHRRQPRPPVPGRARGRDRPRRWPSGRRCSAGSASLGVEEDELRRVFNLGLGYAAVVEADVGAGGARPPLERRRLPRLRRRGACVEGGGGALPLRVGVLISGTGTNLQVADRRLPTSSVRVRRVEPRRRARRSSAPRRAGDPGRSRSADDGRDDRRFLDGHGVELVVLRRLHAHPVRRVRRRARSGGS